MSATGTYHLHCNTDGCKAVYIPSTPHEKVGDVRAEAAESGWTATKMAAKVGARQVDACPECTAKVMLGHAPTISAPVVGDV